MSACTCHPGLIGPCPAVVVKPTEAEKAGAVEFLTGLGKRPAALLHVETDIDVVLDALARWHREQATDAHPGGFDLCPASPCRDVREAL